MKEIIYVDVEKVIYLMRHYILMPKQNTKEYFLMELLIYKKKESKIKVQIAGK